MWTGLGAIQNYESNCVEVMFFGGQKRNLDSPIQRPGDCKLARGGYRARVDRTRVPCEIAHRLVPTGRQVSGLERVFASRS